MSVTLKRQVLQPDTKRPVSAGHDMVQKEVAVDRQLECCC